jgi:hypothetical protein
MIKQTEEDGEEEATLLSKKPKLCASAQAKLDAHLLDFVVCNFQAFNMGMFHKFSRKYKYLVAI